MNAFVFSRTTVFLLIVAMICGWLNWQHSSLHLSNLKQQRGSSRRLQIVDSATANNNSNRNNNNNNSNNVNNNNNQAFLSSDEAEKLVNLAAARLANKNNSIDASARLELQDELPFVPYWEKDDDALRAANDGAIDSEFTYRLHSNDVIRARSQCGSTQKAQRKRFDDAFDNYVKLHADMIAGRVPAKFVHVGILHKSSLQNNIKVQFFYLKISYVETTFCDVVVVVVVFLNEGCNVGRFTWNDNWSCSINIMATSFRSRIAILS